jgi:putative transposase
MLVEPCEGELHARFFGGWEETRHQSAMPRGAGRLPPTRQERNICDLLPERDRPQILVRIRGAWALKDPALAKQRLELLASELERTWPDAAASLREGMDETLTLMRLGIDGQLAKSLCSTNPCESMIEIVRYTQRNVKRWQEGDMRKRWTAAGMLVAEQQFRRIIGYRNLAKLVIAIKRHADRVKLGAANSVTRTDTPEVATV